MILTIDDFNTEDEMRIIKKRLEQDISKYIEVEKLKIPRNIRESMNKRLANELGNYVTNSNLEEKRCYLVKGFIDGGEGIFVHDYTSDCKRFKNLETCDVIGRCNINDVLVKKEDRYIIDETATDIVRGIIDEVLTKLSENEELFKIEGNEYFVCEKSDDDIVPEINLRIVGTDKEFWGVKVDADLYNKVVYGSMVKYENGKYVFVK